ncbi:MAG: hypothetical protein HY619_04615 [Thaumarchaeota archaeon]|nr:hypothetical protein [Nitrososphaerota archaeon]
MRTRGIVIGSGLFLLVIGIVAFISMQPSPQADADVVLVRTPTCDCCLVYVEYLEVNGFKVKIVDLEDMATVKERYNIPLPAQSCHTSLIGNYFVEGHVPIDAMRKLLAENPPIDGITLPGMPSGSPGMPGVKTGPFEVYALTNGATSLFMTI